MLIIIKFKKKVHKSTHLSDLQSKPEGNHNRDPELDYYQPSSGIIILTSVLITSFFFFFFLLFYNPDIPKCIFSKSHFVLFSFFLNFSCLE